MKTKFRISQDKNKLLLVISIVFITLIIASQITIAATYYIVNASFKPRVAPGLPKLFAQEASNISHPPAQMSMQQPIENLSFNNIFGNTGNNITGNSVSGQFSAPTLASQSTAADGLRVNNEAMPRDNNGAATQSYATVIEIGQPAAKKESVDTLVNTEDNIAKALSVSNNNIEKVTTEKVITNEIKTTENSQPIASNSINMQEIGVDLPSKTSQEQKEPIREVELSVKGAIISFFRRLFG